MAGRAFLYQEYGFYSKYALIKLTWSLISNEPSMQRWQSPIHNGTFNIFILLINW